MVLSVGNDPTFKRFCEAFDLTHLLEDPRFATNAARVENRQLVTDTLTPVMQLHPTGWWIEKLEALKIGCGPINKLSEVFADPHVIARNMVVEMAHGSGQAVKVIANPVKLSETPPDYRIAPPLLGEHTDSVLSERLGLDKATLASLGEKGVILAVPDGPACGCAAGDIPT
jgi:crotonobetainyl-CoA:carnitine CoA-transferase CaiB-like acyl-CoA transferase